MERTDVFGVLDVWPSGYQTEIRCFMDQHTGQPMIVVGLIFDDQCIMLPLAGARDLVKDIVIDLQIAQQCIRNDGSVDIDKMSELMKDAEEQ